MGLFGLRFGDHVEPVGKKIRPEERSRMTKAKTNRCDKQVRLAHFDLEKSLVWDRRRKCTWDTILLSRSVRYSLFAMNP